MEDKRSFDRLFRALGDQHRLEILDLLMESSMNAGQLLEAVDVVQSTLSHHMKTLTQAGLVRARKDGKWTWYCIDEDAVRQAQLFLERYRRSESEAAPEQIGIDAPAVTQEGTPGMQPTEERPERLPEAEDVFGAGGERPAGKKKEKAGRKKEKTGKDSGKKKKKKRI